MRYIELTIERFARRRANLCFGRFMMKMKKHLLIVTTTILFTWLSCCNIFAASTTICPNCGGMGYTTFALYNQVPNGIGSYNLVPSVQRVPCASCGGSGRVYSGTDATSSSAS